MTVRSDTVAQLADWHPPACTCPSCEPAPEHDPLDAPLQAEPSSVSAQIVAGFGFGMLLCALLDLATGQHGVLLMLGLR